jgi:hypothetical protein
MTRPLLLLVALAAAPCLRAGESDGFGDKARYSLFNPTPRALMRELSTDRPDKTESPFTVDAGHFQIEADLISYSYDRHNPEHADVRVESWSFATLNLKAGLLNNIDLQVVVPSYAQERTRDRDAGTIEEAGGFGDVITRLKVNVWGNDGGKTAFAVMPFVKWPTAENDLGNGAIEGGVILPLAVELPAEWGMGVMTQVDFTKDSTGGGFHAEWINTITFGHDIVGPLAGYVEFFSLVSAEEDADWIGTVDLGLTYAIHDDVQLDTGINIGVTRAADDFNPFLGISVRF